MTDSFFKLSPDRVLDAAENSGLLVTGRCIPLNSYENRVYELELEPSSEAEDTKKHAIHWRRVIKFYRPGRWTRDQIAEEHEFLFDLLENEIPVVAPERFSDGSSLHTTEEGLFYAIFPKVGGRIPDEMDTEKLTWLGRLLARIHSVGASKPARHRMRLNHETYGTNNLTFLLEGNWIPHPYTAAYERAAREIIAAAEVFRNDSSAQRIHGDCHRGNLLWGTQGPFFLDFDDMVVGPPVQDVWLLVPGRDEEAKLDREAFLEGYEEMRSFDRSSLKWIEILRALRYIHYAAWLARRWNDPAFPLAFPQFNTPKYWEDQTRDLMEQVGRIQEAL